MADTNTDTDVVAPGTTGDRPDPDADVMARVTPPPSTGFDIQSLVRQATPADIDIPGATSRVAGIMGEEAGATDWLRQRNLDRLYKDRQRVQRAYDATGIGQDELKPWNADQEKAARTTGPLETFGSLGFIFAMAASSFTRTPMINALNSGAAAMNAIHQGDEEAYKQAYEAWKANTDLAIKRHTLQQKDFDNALRLMDTDQALGNAELQAVTARYGDQKARALADAGYVKELYELQKSRAASAEKLIRDLPVFEREIRKQAILGADPDYQSGDPTKMAQAVRRAEDAVAPAKAVTRKRADAGFDETVKQRVTEGMTPDQAKEVTTAEYNDALSQDTQVWSDIIGDKPTPAETKALRSSLNESGINEELRQAKLDRARQRLEAIQAQGRLPTPQERVEILEEAVAKPSRTTGSQFQNEKAQILRDLKSTDPVIRERGQRGLDALNKLSAASKPPTATEKQYEQGRKNAQVTLDEALKLVEDQVKRQGPSVTGIKGEARRWWEWGAGSLGWTDKTAAHDFQQKALILQSILPRILGARSNVSKEERANMLNIVGGLSRFTPSAASLKDLQFLQKLISRPDDEGSIAPSEASPKQTEKIPPKEVLEGLEEGDTVKFKNGQEWTLRDGKPFRVK